MRINKQTYKLRNNFDHDAPKCPSRTSFFSLHVRVAQNSDVCARRPVASNCQTRASTSSILNEGWNGAYCFFRSELCECKGLFTAHTERCEPCPDYVGVHLRVCGGGERLYVLDVQLERHERLAEPLDAQGLAQLRTAL